MVWSNFSLSVLLRTTKTAPLLYHTTHKEEEEEEEGGGHLIKPLFFVFSRHQRDDDVINDVNDEEEVTMAVREAFFLSFALESIMRDENIQQQERDFFNGFSLSLSLSLLSKGRGVRRRLTTLSFLSFSLFLRTLNRTRRRLRLQNRVQNALAMRSMMQSTRCRSW